MQLSVVVPGFSPQTRVFMAHYKLPTREVEDQFSNCVVLAGRAPCTFYSFSCWEVGLPRCGNIHQPLFGCWGTSFVQTFSLSSSLLLPLWTSEIYGPLRPPNHHNGSPTEASSNSTSCQRISLSCFIPPLHLVSVALLSLLLCSCLNAQQWNLVEKQQQPQKNTGWFLKMSPHHRPSDFSGKLSTLGYMLSPLPLCHLCPHGLQFNYLDSDL